MRSVPKSLYARQYLVGAHATAGEGVAVLNVWTWSPDSEDTTSIPGAATGLAFVLLNWRVHRTVFAACGNVVAVKREAYARQLQSSDHYPLRRRPTDAPDRSVEIADGLLAEPILGVKQSHDGVASARGQKPPSGRELRRITRRRMSLECKLVRFFRWHRIGVVCDGLKAWVRQDANSAISHGCEDSLPLPGKGHLEHVTWLLVRREHRRL